MRTKIDLDTWERADHFRFFNSFEEPFFSVVVNVDCTHAYSKARQMGVSFFLYYLHCTLTAVNHIIPFKYRAEGDEVFLYDDVNASATVDRPNGTFGFSYIDYDPDLTAFVAGAKEEIGRVRSTTGLDLRAQQNILHISAIPWINFTALTHARSFSYKDSVPKISYGKLTDNNGRKSMPVSVTVHHGLMDGLHVGEFIDLFQKLLNG